MGKIGEDGLYYDDNGNLIGSYDPSMIGLPSGGNVPILFGAPQAIAGGARAVGSMLSSAGNWLSSTFPLATRGARLAFGVEGAKNLASEEGVKKTKRKISEGDYKGAIKSGVGDVFDLVMAGDAIRAGRGLYEGYKLANAATGAKIAKGANVGRYQFLDDIGNGAEMYSATTDALKGMNNAKRAYIANKVADELNEASKVSREGPNYTDDHFRYRLGDVEVNDPNTHYREGVGIVDDFFKRGYVDAHNPNVEKETGRFKFLKGFGEPMFRQGKRWYGADTELLTTREPMFVATKEATPMPNALHSNSGRRVPVDKETLTPENTFAYKYEPGYGYRQVGTVKEPYVSFLDAKQQHDLDELKYQLYRTGRELAKMKGLNPEKEMPPRRYYNFLH